MATKEKIKKTIGLSETIDVQENLQSQLDTFKETFLKECKQIESSNVELLDRVNEMQGVLEQHKAIITRLRDRMGL
jgi:hypothetical protein